MLRVSARNRIGVLTGITLPATVIIVVVVILT